MWSLLTLQNQPFNATETYTLTSASSVVESTADSITIGLSVQDLNSIKLADLGSHTTNTYLTTEDGAVSDISRNFLVMPKTPLQVYQVLPDQTPPQLLNFTLDLNTSQLILTFQEAVDITTINVSGLTIIPSRGVIDPQRTLMISKLHSFF